MKKLYRKFLAYFRLDLTVVCEESKGDKDYHDYHDDKNYGMALHFHNYECSRCGKIFRI